MRTFFISLILFWVEVSLAQPTNEFLYVGTFSVRGSKGIYVFKFNRAKGTLTPVQEVETLASPSFLAIHPTGNFLYSVNRGAVESDMGGSVSAFTVDRKTGKLSLLNQRPSYGNDPCHIAIDNTGKFAFVSNYNGENLIVLPLFKDGLIGTPSDALRFSGTGINPTRQDKPHIHSATISPNNRFVYICDLGTDKIYIYTYDALTGKMRPALTMPEVQVSPGSGPRHFAFHPTGKFAYISEELTSTLGAFSVNPETGAMTALMDSIPTLPKNFTENNTSADIQVEPQGKFLFQSNRGLNALAVFSIAKTGIPTLLHQQPTGGKTPRNILIDPKGDFVFVANQDTDTIVVFRLNKKTGTLTQVGTPLKVPSPVCLKLLQ